MFLFDKYACALLFLLDVNANDRDANEDIDTHAFNLTRLTS